MKNGIVEVWEKADGQRSKKYPKKAKSAAKLLLEGCHDHCVDVLVELLKKINQFDIIRLNDFTKMLSEI